MKCSVKEIAGFRGWGGGGAIVESVGSYSIEDFFYKKIKLIWRKPKVQPDAQAHGLREKKHFFFCRNKNDVSGGLGG